LPVCPIHQQANKAIYLAKFVSIHFATNIPLSKR
jgi:hypothetical protein